MEMFRINGMSSETLMRPGQNPTKAFLGSMFKMEDPAAKLAAQEAEAKAAAAVAAAVPAGTEDAHRWTEKELAALPKEKLVELGSAFGVADLSQAKAKLIEGILAVQ
jgi:hypothetical protein